ncbi:Pc22g00710 [Penicillium rubens Wisconsin 54-1255]|uniref:Pc22g00710 protein n=1 Tax=Penicillium rubens (strain ATCC 28089 / DSM 1075 / NRRL 1951 / Wisconsin 54-1255) TaxID=500485 RepID=B6HPI4_PENRW|nr:Pc22g00710 [Penicillium rubens Wisconsin 54-1255]
MLSIKSLLNPQPERRNPHPSFPASREKRQKMAKDAPVFRRGKIQGECRYPPCEERDAELEKAHRELSLRPFGNIADYPRQIPYASDKKTFQEKTGRDSFHVFQYTFQIPGEEKEWHVMWDYNIGIVRITHLFKCNGYSKASLQGKMLNQNPGLRDICHSITGGALSAQGYWMPYEAAKAMAATFCWRIRYALTPLFGTEFPAMCIPPTDRKTHGRMVIPPDIVQRATNLSNYYRSLEMKSSAGANPPAINAPSSTHTLLRGMGIPRTKYADSNPSARDSSMEPYCMSPRSQSSMSTFTPINPPRSSNVIPRSRVESPRAILRAISDAMRPENVPGGISDSETESDGSSNMYSTPNSPPVDDKLAGLDEPTNPALEVVATQSDYDDLTDSDDDWQMDDDDDEDYRGPPLKKTLVGAPVGKDGSTSPASLTKKYPSRKSRAARPQPSPHFTREVKAAEALLRLHMNELESTGTETEMDDDELTSPPDCRSLDGDESRSRKRRRASL